MNAILDAALAFCEAGCSVVPAMADGSKAPAGKWQRWQSGRPDAAQVTAWLSNGRHDGFGVVCGAVSGGLEMLELEGRAVRAGLTAQYRDVLDGHELGELWRRIVTGYAETTPGGGLHILYRVDGTPRGNRKLAVTASGDVLIETRGEGGFVIVAPSGGGTHPTGKPWQLAKGGPGSIAVITEDERDALHAIASLLTQAVPRQPVIPATASGSGDRPGDDFSARTSWQDILAPHGWQCTRAFGSDAHGWRRPGKEGPGISATTREDGGLYVFSTSTPFDTEVPYSKFGAYGLLNHGGDYAAAAKALRAVGYGSPPEHDDDGIDGLIVGPRRHEGAEGASSQRLAPSAPSVSSSPLVLRLADVKPERVAWLWDGYLPLGKQVTLDGDPGVGKSTVSLDIAARVSTGSPMPDGTQPVRGAVLVLSAEDGLADTIRPRLDAAGADPGQVFTITGITAPDGSAHPVSIPGDLPVIEHVIAEHGVVLLIVDVLMAFLSGQVNSHRDQDIRRALHVLAAVAERTGCCVIVLRHLNKASGGNAIYRGGGSIGIIGAARAGYMCGTDPDDESRQRRVFACVKSNLAAEPPALAYRLVPDDLRCCARIQWEGISQHKAATLLSEPDDPDERNERDEAAEWLTSYLIRNGGEAIAGDVIKAARGDGIAPRTLQRARKRANVTTAKAAFGSGWVWRIDTTAEANQ